MNHRLFFYSVLSVAISACSGTNNAKRASGDFDYAKTKEPAPLKVPASLVKPTAQNKYLIASEINKQGPVGDKMDIRAPSLVLPVAAGTRVEIKEPGTKIWFDQVLDNQALEPFVVNAIEQELLANQSSLLSKDDQQKRYQSDWIAKSTEQGFWLWKSTYLLNKMKFQFELETKPHGRSVAVIVNLTDYQVGINEEDEPSGDTILDPIDKQRAEVAMLNAVVGQVDYQYRLQQQQKRELKASQRLVSVTQNNKGEPAYLVEMEMDSLWSNLPLFFEHYGFTITDLNETKKIYYVDYVKPKAGFWTSLWGDEPVTIDIADGKYLFDLSEQGENSFVTISDGAGAVLSHETLNAIFPAIEPGLSFRSTK
jgi:outer membrane protein assembly factor BamC